MTSSIGSGLPMSAYSAAKEHHEDHKEFDLEYTTLYEEIRADEGEGAEVYLDSEGYPTIGVGHKLTEEERNLFGTGREKYPVTKAGKNQLKRDYTRDGKVLTWDKERIEAQYDYDLRVHMEEARKAYNHYRYEQNGIPWTDLPMDARKTITNMTYNMGEPKLRREFPNFLRAMSKGQWELASYEIMYKDGAAVLQGGDSEHSDYFKQLNGLRVLSGELDTSRPTRQVRRVSGIGGTPPPASYMEKGTPIKLESEGMKEHMVRYLNLTTPPRVSKALEEGAGETAFNIFNTENSINDWLHLNAEELNKWKRKSGMDHFLAEQNYMERKFEQGMKEGWWKKYADPNLPPTVRPLLSDEMPEDWPSTDEGLYYLGSYNAPLVQLFPKLMYDPGYKLPESIASMYEEEEGQRRINLGTAFRLAKEHGFEIDKREAHGVYDEVYERNVAGYKDDMAKFKKYQETGKVAGITEAEEKFAIQMLRRGLYDDAYLWSADQGTAYPMEYGRKRTFGDDEYYRAEPDAFMYTGSLPKNTVYGPANTKFYLSASRKKLKEYFYEDIKDNPLFQKTFSLGGSFRLLPPSLFGMQPIKTTGDFLRFMDDPKKLAEYSRLRHKFEKWTPYMGGTYKEPGDLVPAPGPGQQLQNELKEVSNGRRSY